MWIQLDGLFKGDMTKISLQHTVQRTIRDIFESRLNAHVRGVQARQRQRRGHGRVLDDHRAGGGQKNFLPDAAGAITNGGNPIPSQRAEKSWAVDGVFAAVWSHAVWQRVLVTYSRMRRWMDEDSQGGLLSRCDHARDIENTPREGAADGSRALSVHPDIGGVIDAIKIQPDFFSGKAFWHFKNRAIPIGSPAKAFGNFIRPIVFSVERFGIN